MSGDNVDFLERNERVINPDALAAPTPQRVRQVLAPLFRLLDWPPDNVDVNITPIRVPAVSTIFIAGDRRIKYLLIQNNGAGNLFLAVGRDATVQDLIITPGGNYEPLRPPKGNIYLLAAVAATPAVIVYGL